MDDARALAILGEALDVPEAQRAAFVDAACNGDRQLRDAVLGLLRAHARSGGFLEQPVAWSHPVAIGPYRLLERIGAGGMGQVWLAERDDGAFRQKVAIKVLASALADPEMVRRAEAERQFLAGLNHPNIAHVIDGGTTPEGQPYVVMEYVDGLRIDAWCQRNRCDLRARVTLFLQVLDAVDAAHRALIIHRDIKPSNVMVTTEGRVKLLDFGIAKSLEETRVAGSTATGFAALTPQYASPEQLAARRLTTASDVYSLGLLLYELLSGAPARPIAAQSVRDLAELMAAPPPTRPSLHVEPQALGLAERAAAEWRRSLSGDLDRIVLKALAGEPERRYASARAFADDLQRWLERRPVSARGDGWGYRIGKFAVRHRVLVSVAALAIVGVLGALAAAVIQARRAEQQAGRAEQVSRFMLDIVNLADPFISGGTPTLEQAINRAAATLGERFEGQPDLEGEIRQHLGRAYLSLNQLDAAQWQLERSIALREGGDPIELADAHDALATVEWSWGRYDNAERRFREALAMLGDGDRERASAAIIHNDYAAMLNDMGRYEDAHARIEQALRIADDGALVGEADRGAMLANLGYALHGLGRLEEASIAYSRSATLLASAGATAPERAINLNNHALVLYDLGQRDKALALQEESLALRRQAFPGGHPLVVQALANIANHYVDAGRNDDARRAAEEAIEQAPLHFPEGNVMLGHVYRNGARALLGVGDARRAGEVAQHALDTYAKIESAPEESVRKARELLEEAKAAIADTQASSSRSPRRRAR